MSERYDRGTVVKGPDLFADPPPTLHLPQRRLPPIQRRRSPLRSQYNHPPSHRHPTRRRRLRHPHETYVNPWTVVTDIVEQEGHLIDPTTETIAEETAGYLGIQ